MIPRNQPEEPKLITLEHLHSRSLAQSAKLSVSKEKCYITDHQPLRATQTHSFGCCSVFIVAREMNAHRSSMWELN